jgi:ribonuclease BN (tRNA processing enzyme)
VNDIETLFLTHLHADHTVGVPDLWLTLDNRTAPLHVFGPEATRPFANSRVIELEDCTGVRPLVHLL